VFATSQRFLGKLGFRGLVSCRSRSQLLSFRAFPSQGSRTPLEAACSPAVIHRRAMTRRPRPCHREFHRTPRPRKARSPDSPRDYGSPFHEAEASLPGRPGSRATEPSRSASFTYFGAYAPPANPFTTDPSFPAPAADALLDFAPLEPSPPAPRNLTPASASRLKHAHPRRCAATLGTSRPPAPGETSPPPDDDDSTSSADPNPLRDWAAPPRGGVPSPSTLGASAWPSEPRSTREAASSPRRYLLFWGSLPPRQPRGFGTLAGPG
jgi:hypothetical protein